MIYSVILLTCNRLRFTKQAIEALKGRINDPKKIKLIVVDDKSTDGTLEYLKGLKNLGEIDVLIDGNKSPFFNISEGWNKGLEYVDSEYFFTTFDDIVVPKINPDVVDSLVALMDRNLEYGGIACRIQRIPNLKCVEGDITSSHKGLASYFRIQKKSDIDKVKNFGSSPWEEFVFTRLMRKIDKKCGWANNIWCNHLGYCENRGYDSMPDKDGTWRRKQDLIRKPYPKVDEQTNIPLLGERRYND